MKVGSAAYYGVDVFSAIYAGTRFTVPDGKFSPIYSSDKVRDFQTGSGFLLISNDAIQIGTGIGKDATQIGKGIRKDSE